MEADLLRKQILELTKKLEALEKAEKGSVDKESVEGSKDGQQKDEKDKRKISSNNDDPKGDAISEKVDQSIGTGDELKKSTKDEKLVNKKADPTLKSDSEKSVMDNDGGDKKKDQNKDSSEGSGVLFSNVEAQKLLDESRAKVSNIARDLMKNVKDTASSVTAVSGTAIDKVNYIKSSGLKFVEGVPSFFSLSVEGKPRLSYPGEQFGGQPKYLKKSFETFSFGVSEVKVQLKSREMTPEISFVPGMVGNFNAIIQRQALGAVEKAESRVSYVLAVMETIFGMSLACQVVLKKPSPKIMAESGIYTGDLISGKGMIGNKFLDQDFALLPAGGYGNSAQFMNNRLCEMFEDEQHRMRLCEVGSSAMVSAKKISTVYACITDQWFSAGNELYLKDLKSRRTNSAQYLRMHEVLTFPGVKVDLEFVGGLDYSVVPFWNYDEADGAILIAALQIDEQIKRLNGLAGLLLSTNLLGFYKGDQIPKSHFIHQMKDTRVKTYFNDISGSLTEADFYKTLAAELLTTWSDFEIENTITKNDPLHCVFDVFTVLLWFLMFPAIAVDNLSELMYKLFMSLQVLIGKELQDYIREKGFVMINGIKNDTITCYSRERVILGDVKYTILLNDHKTGLMHEIHRFLIDRHGEVVDTRDAQGNVTPRINHIRRYYQPWNFIPKRRQEGPELNAIPPNNDFGGRMISLFEIMVIIINKYKRLYRGCSSTSSFGGTDVSMADLVTLFRGVQMQDYQVFGHVFHCELYRLRELGQNSVFVIDDTFVGDLEPRARRPQVFAMVRDKYIGYGMQRARSIVKFNIPVYMWLSMRGFSRIEEIVPPVSTDQMEILRSMQEDGILLGDIISFTNKLKYDETPSMFNNEMLGISAQISATRSSEIYRHLASKYGSNERLKNLFTLSIANTMIDIDMRAKGLRICLGEYGRTEQAPQIADVGYGRLLRLDRKLTSDLYNMFSSLFVPEMSPLALYTRGLLISKYFTQDLNPYDKRDIEELLGHNSIIIGWAPSLVCKVTTSSQCRDTRVLRIPNGNGSSVDYQFTDMELMPSIFIVLSANTSGIPTRDLEFLKPFFLHRKVHFVLPDLLVIIAPIRSATIVQSDYNLDIQFEDILTGAPTRRITVQMYDTRRAEFSLSMEDAKCKWFWLLSDMPQPDVVMRGLLDDKIEPPDFKLSPWYMWCYGVDGRNVLFSPHERIRHDIGAGGDNDRATLVNKLDLGVVNFNNTLEFYDSEEFLKPPTLTQSPEDLQSRFLEM